MSEFSVYEKMRAADREARLRRGFYERMVASGRMTQGKADYQLMCMQAIADEYRAQWDGVVPELSIEDWYMA